MARSQSPKSRVATIRPSAAASTPSSVVEKKPATTGSSSKKRVTPTLVVPDNAHVEYEFMGPYLGPIGIVIGLPILVFLACYYCNDKRDSWSVIPEALPTGELAIFLSLEAHGVYLSWFFFQMALYLFVPGAVAEGTVLRDGSRLKYPINGKRRRRRQRTKDEGA